MSKILFSNVAKGFAIGIGIGVVVTVLSLLTLYASIDPWRKSQLVFGTVFSFAWLGGFIGFFGGIVAIIRRHRQS